MPAALMYRQRFETEFLRSCYIIMKQSDWKIILASASPRRRELLSQVGLEFECMPSDCEEVITTSVPSEAVRELSLLKAENIADRLADSGGRLLIIGADTVVALDGMIMGKPRDKKDAAKMLSKLQGREHSVFTGVTLIFIRDKKQDKLTFAKETKVRMYPMNEAQIQEYVDSGEPMDKAGAYAIQGLCAAYIEGIDGDYNTVVGLPVGEICRILRERED